jgi:hypothetical protein
MGSCRSSPRAIDSTSRRDFVLAGHPGDTAHLPGLLGTCSSPETEERIPSAADGGCIALAAVGRAVHGTRRPASWVKLCPDHRPPRPIGEINRRLWDLPWRSLEVYATVGAWHESLPQGLSIERAVTSWCRRCRLRRQGHWFGPLQLQKRRTSSRHPHQRKEIHTETGIRDDCEEPPCPRQPSLINPV